MDSEKVSGSDDSFKNAEASSMHPSRLKMIKQHGALEDEDPHEPEVLIKTGSNDIPLGGPRQGQSNSRKRKIPPNTPQQPAKLDQPTRPKAKQTKKPKTFHRDYPDSITSHGTVTMGYFRGPEVLTSLASSWQFYSSMTPHTISTNQRYSPLGCLPSPAYDTESFTRDSTQFQKLSFSNDENLLNYLRRRQLSPAFLSKIDCFLASHPGIKRHAPRFFDEFNSLSPLNAYRYFLKGYSKPAIYLPGVIPDGHFTLPSNFKFTPLSKKVDEELNEFFEGYQYRYDILERIDQEVALMCSQILIGARLTAEQRLLVAYTILGNPVDAYKYFEYNYQTEWMLHRSLPEHVILSEIPPSLQCDNMSTAETFRGFQPKIPGGEQSHQNTRLRMARAKYLGVDAIGILLDDFVETLRQRGIHDSDIERLKGNAAKTLQQESENPIGTDIVDLIMGMAEMEISHASRSPSQQKHYYTQPEFAIAEPRSTSLTQVISVESESKDAKVQVKPGVANKAEEKVARKKQDVLDRLKRSADNLGRLYLQEALVSAESRKSLTEMVAACRRAAEQEYLKCLELYWLEFNFKNLGEIAKIRGKYTNKASIALNISGLRFDLFGLFPPSTFA